MRSSVTCQTKSTGPEDGPEEGEIVSDDLEDISDESIIFTPCNGKSLSRSDHLHALSLSSITDIEEPPPEKKKRRKSYSQRRTKRKKRSRKKLIDSDSSDDDTTLDRRLKLQLKAAVCVNVEEAHRNSLRTRLRAMVQSVSGPESDTGITEPKLEKNEPDLSIGSLENALSPSVKEPTIIEILSGTESVPSAPEIILSAPEIIPSTPENIESGAEQAKDDIDSELMQLRIEALKTAINNKFANRKRRKKECLDPTVSDDTNKENTNNNNGESEIKKTEVEMEISPTSPQLSNELENDEPPSPEEDEDVLRALLLASMSKKITSIESEPTKTFISKRESEAVVVNFNKISTNKRIGSVNNFKLNNIRKGMINIKNIVNKASGATKLVKMPTVKPLIINVNSDSDSDLDLSSSPEKSPKKPQKISEKDSDGKSLENKVLENLEKTIESSVDKFLREQRAKVESEIQIVSRADTSPVKTNSVVATANSTVSPNSKNTLVVKNVQNTKTITFGIKTVTPALSKVNANSNKIPQLLKNTPENPKKILFADLEKSALKFLPENKREEYKQLQNLLKLKRAQLKKPRVRRISQRLNDSKNLKTTLVDKNKAVSDKNGLVTNNTPQIINKVIVSKNSPTVNVTQATVSNKNLLTTSGALRAKQNKTKLVSRTVSNEINCKTDSTNQLSKFEARNQERMNQHARIEIRNQERKSDALLLHTTLKQVQTRKDGRLQIQERYKSLRPLVKKINDVSKEQKNWDQEVNRLLEQLSEARKKQQEVHRNMSAFVRELAERKQNIDESIAKVINKPKINNLITSTPVKQNVTESTLELSAVPSFSSSPISADRGTNESTLIAKNKTHSQSRDKISEISDRSNKLVNTWEQKTEVNTDLTVQTDNVKRVASDTDLNVVDPNDIDNIIRKTEEKVAVLDKKEDFECRRAEKTRYVSPLDSVKRNEDLDPFAIMCPFEVNGTCKDPECIFKHLPK